MYSVPNKLKLILILSISLLLFCANCKKKEIQLRYPEDPSTTTLTPRERLTAAWALYGYTFNGNNIIPKLDSIFGGKGHIEDVTISYDFNTYRNKWIFIMGITGYYFNFSSENNFNSHDPSYIILYQDPSYIKLNGVADPYLAKWFITPFVYDPNDFDATAKWKITKLFDEELNLVLETDTGNYKIFLKKF